MPEKYSFTGLSAYETDKIEAAPSGFTLFYDELLYFFDRLGRFSECGLVRGPTGPKGPDGEVSREEAEFQFFGFRPGPWTNIALVSPWQNLNSTHYPLRYRIVGDRVELDGAIQWKGAPGQGHVKIADLPAEAVPTYECSILQNATQPFICDVRAYSPARGSILEIYIHGSTWTLATDDWIGISGSYPLS